MHFGLGGFGMILVWVAVIAVVVVVVKLLSDSTRNRDTNSRTALQFLEDRYASGEITRDEFAEKKRDLSQR